VTPCPRCGSTERYKSGRCAPCTRASNQRWKKSNTEKHRAGSARWASENPEKVRGYARESGRRNPDRVKSNLVRWRAEHSDRHSAQEHARRARKQGNGGSYTELEWLALCAEYGNRCLCCGATGVKLTADHVIPVKLGGSSYITNIQPLCRPCNSQKATATTDYRLAA
jgi:5-methylcytosine-specific restriction endonuclease McrA